MRVLALLFLSVAAFAQTTVVNGFGGGGGGTGTATSVGLSMPATLCSVTNSPVTTSGTLTCTYATGQTANLILGSNGSGNVGLMNLTAAQLPAIASTSLSDTSALVRTTDTGTVTNTMLAGSIATAKITGLATSATTDTTNASNISSGTLPAGRLPALTGDVTASAGSNSVSVAKLSGSAPASYVAYDKSYWSDLSDFTVVGSTPTVSNGAIQLSAAYASSFSTQGLVLNSPKTQDEAVDFTVYFTVVTAPTSTSNGLAIGGHSFNAWSASNLIAQYNPVNTGNGLLQFYSTDRGAVGGTIGSPVSQTGTPPSAGDNCVLTYSVRGSEVTATFVNLTQSVGITSTINSNGIAWATPNSRQYEVLALGGTYNITHISVVSKEPSYPNVAVIGDSKTFGYSAGNPSSAWPSQIQSLGPIAYFGGNADRTVEVVQETDYIIALHPKYALLNIGRNDLASGVASATWQANYQSIVTALTNAGITVIHLMPIPETSTSQTTLTSWINSTYPTDPKIDVTGSWSNAVDLYSDGIHPNTPGHQLIAQQVIAAGLITSKGALYWTDPLEAGRLPQTINSAAGGTITGLTAGALSYASTSTALTSSTLFQESASLLGQRNGSTAQTHRIFNTYTSSGTNSEYVDFTWSSPTFGANTFSIESRHTGTGSIRPMRIRSEGQLNLTANSLYLGGSPDTSYWNISSSGHFTAVTDNSSDIGASGATRPRNIYVAGFVKVPATIPSTLYSAAGTALPTCAVGIQGEDATVSDATAPSYMGAYTSGGAITTKVICSYNGSTYSWLTH